MTQPRWRSIRRILIKFELCPGFSPSGHIYVNAESVSSVEEFALEPAPLSTLVMQCGTHYRVLGSIDEVAQRLCE